MANLLASRSRTGLRSLGPVSSPCVSDRQPSPLYGGQSSPGPAAAEITKLSGAEPASALQSLSHEKSYGPVNKQVQQA